MISAFNYDKFIWGVNEDDSTFKICPVSYCGFFKELPKKSFSMKGYYKDGDFFRVEFKDWESRNNWRLSNPNVESFELDVGSIRRAISDNHKVKISKPKRAFIDLETDSRIPIQEAILGKSRILSWAIVLDDNRKYSAIVKEDSDKEEYRILKELWEILDFERVQQLVAWNGDGFDFSVLEFRCKKFSLFKFRMRYMLHLDHMQVFKKANAHASESSEEKRSYALGNICQHLLGHGKLDVDASQSYKLWRDDPRALLEYNEHDTALLKELEESPNGKPYLEMYQALFELTHSLPNSHSIKPTSYTDGYLLRKASVEGFRLPTKKENDPYKFQGAFVLEPQKTGIIEKVAAADFKGLYPSIIRSFNLSYETIDPNGPCTAPLTGIRSRLDVKGLIPIMLEEMVSLRSTFQQQKEEYDLGTPEYKKASTLADAVKTITNSVYGILGSIYSRFYNKDAAEACTQVGVWLNRDLVMEEVAKRGWQTLYGDTDSTLNIGTSYEEFKEFVNWCNTVLIPEKLKECGCVDNYVKLNFDKVFHRIVFPLNDKGKPVKKRYAGWYSKPGGETTALEIKGMEYKRGDAMKLATMMQKEIIDSLETATVIEDVLPIVEKWKKRLFNDVLDVDDITLSRAISKELSEYKAKNSPQVRMAERALTNGDECIIGSKMSYIVIDATVSPAEIVSPDKYEGDADRQYLWNKRVWPASRRLLTGSFPNFNWNAFNVKKTRRIPKEQLGLFT